MKNAIGVIPARFGSTRFPKKVIADLNGKPIIQHIWENCKKAKMLDDLVIATDNDEVMEVIKSFGGKAVFTSPDHMTGTDRIAEVVNAIDVNVIVNIQGDEPLIQAEMVDSLVRTILDHKNISMASLMKKMENLDEINNPNVVKVIVDKNGFAIYFSRSPIPYPRLKEEAKLYYKHLGIYAYTKDFLYEYTNLPKSYLEKCESLEQLRVLENGYKIKMVETKFDTIGVDTPDDLEKVKSRLEANV